MEAKQAKKENQMASSTHPKSPNLFRIIRQSLIFLIKNPKLVLIFIFLYLISFSIPIFKSSSTTPILTNLLKNLTALSKLNPPNPDFYQTITTILKELREITLIETVFFITAFFLSTLLLTAALCFICMSYADNKQPSLKELFSKFRKRCKGAMITHFYVTIFTKMAVFLMVLLIGGSVLFSMDSAGFLVVSFITFIAAVILYLYLVMIWMLSMVVSVEEEKEEGIYGLVAIVKATEMIKGRRWRGILIAAFMILLEMFALFFPLNHLSSSGVKKMVIFGLILVVAAVVNVFNLVVMTVFYFECKKGDEGLVKNECGLGYCSLPSEDLIDKEIP